MEERLPIIPNYHVDHVLSDSGGFAVVYWGIDLRTGRAVAIKQPRKASASILRALEQEAEMYLYLSQNNRHITKLKDFIKLDGQDYLVMEFVEGTSLDAYQKKRGGYLSEDEAVPIFLQILDGVGYIHRNGIVHKDIKPGNIMVRNDMIIKLLDMGISAKLKDVDNNPRAVGTPAFMPPEQFNREPCGPYTDIFALGVTLFAMLTGRLPYSGATTTEIWNQIQSGLVPDVQLLNPYVNPKFQPVLNKALRPEPWERYQTCDEMATAIKTL